MKCKKIEQHVIIPHGVSVMLIDGYYHFSGPKGKIKHKLNEFLSVDLSADGIRIFCDRTSLKKRESLGIYALINTTCMLFRNYISGVLNLFSRVLILKGVGYKAEYDSSSFMLNLSLGFSHPVKINVPRDIVVEVSDGNNIVIKGVSKFKVGQLASSIREKRLPGIYKGNGIRYQNEIIRLKSPKKSK